MVTGSRELLFPAALKTGVYLLPWQIDEKVADFTFRHTARSSPSLPENEQILLLSRPKALSRIRTSVTELPGSVDGVFVLPVTNCRFALASGPQGRYPHLAEGARRGSGKSVLSYARCGAQCPCAAGHHSLFEVVSLHGPGAGAAWLIEEF